jgi:hypothetical protein
VALLVLLAVLTTACARPTDAETAEAAPTPPETTQRRPQPPSSQPNTEEEHDIVTTIRITVADQTITAQLADNPTGQDLASQLPLTLSIRDFNRVEKIAGLPRPLSMDGVPAGDDPDVNDIGYYAPSRSLVFYYGDVGYWNGIVRIGRFSDRDIELIERQSDGFKVTVERG